MRTAAELEQSFRALGVDCSSIEFYNQSAFLEAEKKNPRLLADYGEYVEVKHYAEEYLQRSRHIVTKVTTFLRRELARDGRLGACHDAAFAMMKILEQLGIWCHISAGSLTVEFDAETGLAPRYWAHVFEKRDAVGHAWVVAPPFKAVDLTISQQANIESIKSYLPDYVITEETGPVAGVALEDILDRDLEAAMRQSGHPVPTIHELMKMKSDIADTLTTFRPFSIQFPPATLKYFPCQPSALEERFEVAKSHCFSGRSIPEVFRNLLSEIGSEIGVNDDPSSAAQLS